jgi:hypothetical protein
LPELLERNIPTQALKLAARGVSPVKFYVTKIDETHYLSDEARSKVGTHVCYYLYTTDEVTHCCELTPSYLLEACGFETERYDEITEENLYQLMPDYSHYRHCKDVENYLESHHFGDFDSLEEAVEYFQANPRYF